MSSSAPPLKSFEDLYAEIQALPEGSSGEILEPGAVRVTMGRPGRAHRFSFKRALVALGPWDADLGGIGWWIEPEPEVRLGAECWPRISRDGGSSTSPTCHA